MRVSRTLVCLGLLAAGCDGSFGVGQAGDPGYTLRVARDAGGRDAYLAPGTDAGMPPGQPDAWSPGAPPDAWSASDAGPPPSTGCGNAEEQEELRLTNAARASEGLGPLVCDELMTQVARAHSADMCTRRFFDHTNPDGASPFNRMTAAGVRYGTAGENIAAGQSTPAAVHESWMNSPGHRRNILTRGYGRIGIGLHRCSGGAYGHYWTQVFAD